MKSNIIRKVITFCLFVAVIISVLPVNAATRKFSADMLKLADKAEHEQVADAAMDLYERSVKQKILSYVEGFPDVSQEGLNEAVLSRPYPLYSNQQEVSDSKNYLKSVTLNAWEVIVYIEGRPAAVITMNRSDDGYSLNSLTGSLYAEALQEAVSRVDNGTAFIIRFSGQAFFADGNDTVASVNAAGQNEVLPLKSLGEFQTAAAKTIEYYKTQTVMTDGGSVILDYLYGAPPTATSPVLIPAIAAMLAFSGAAIYLRFRKKNS